MTWRSYLAKGQVTIFSKSTCPFCSKVENMLKGMGVSYRIYQADKGEINAGDFAQLKVDSKQNTVPNVWVGETHVGGCDDTMAAKSDGKLKQLLAANGVSSN